MKHLAVFVLFCWCLVALSGCGTSTGPSETDLSAGNGFRIRIAVSATQLVTGGSIQVYASVFDDQNQPVSDDTVPVIFSASEQGITWTSTGAGAEKLIGGEATAVMKWEDPSSGENAEPSRSCLVTASYRGALAQTEIQLTANSF
ncbi:MAG TPA: hypothetical protein VIV61_03130 [Candidatus Ozemobacteraceae bacterium]